MRLFVLSFLAGCSGDTEAVDASMDSAVEASIDSSVDSTATDATLADAASDASANDAAVPDDAAATDASIEDATLSDSAVNDAMVATDAAAESICGCGDPRSSCQEMTGASACVQFLSLCPQMRLPSCPREQVLYTCDAPNDGFYYTYSLTHASLTVQCMARNGTLRTTPPPPPNGAPCSCQRTASGCVETYGAACSTLACSEPGIRTEGACTTAGAVNGSCVSLDGQRRLRFYGVSVADAERTCQALSSGPHYWVPDSV